MSMNAGKGNKVLSFRGRAIDMDKPVRIHRNLHGRGDRKFSICQSGLVVGHTNQLMLGDCKFIVREAGRLRVLREKRKNVHAFIYGWIAKNGAMGMLACNQQPLPARIVYNPYEHSAFVCVDLAEPFEVHIAMAVLINNKGVTSAYVA